MKIILLFVLISMQHVFSQNMLDTINSNNNIMHRYLLPKKEYFDTIEKILITNNIIDSSSITTHLQSPFNLELLKQRDAKFYTSDFCFYIDSICLDKIRISKVVRHLNCQY